MKEKPLTEAEAIRKFQELADQWPKSLWIFCGGSVGINVLRLNPDGSRKMTNSGGVDPSAIVASIDGIQNDGGDF